VAYWPRSKSAITVDSKLVEVGVVVRDGRGRSVGGLTRDDFEINDNGKKRAVTAFSVETFTPPASKVTGTAPVVAEGAKAPAAPKVPRYVAIVFDDLGLDAGEFMRSKAAALRFVKEGFAANDHAGVFTTSQQQNLPFTTDAGKVAEAIAKIGFHQRQVVGGTCPHYTPYDAYAIANNQDRDALEVKVSEYLACHPHGGEGSKRGRGSSGSSLDPGAVREVTAEASVLWEEIRTTSLNTLGSVNDLIDFMAKFDGKRVMLLASAGFLTGTLEQDEDDLITRALHAGVTINSVDAKGLYTQAPVEMTMGSNIRSAIRQGNLGTRPQQAASDILGTLADSTGGLFFHNNNDLTLGFRELGMVPEVSYLLGFAPDAPDGRFHKLKVKVTAKNTEVQARPGYMSVVPVAQAQREERVLDKEAAATDTQGDVPCTFTAELVKVQGGGPAVSVVMHLDAGKLKFREGFGVRSQKLVFITALFDPAGNYVTGKESEMEFALSDATYQQAAAGGINARVTLEASPGEYRLRWVVQETLEGKLTAGTQAVRAQ
jgi:VWFA-related protein